MAGFFWGHTKRTLKKQDQEKEEETSEETKKKILEFWAWCCEFQNQDFIKTRLSQDYNLFLGKLADLTILLDKIDDTSEQWLLLCAPYSNLSHHISFFGEYLTKFEDAESLKKVSKIYLKVLENTTPTYEQENIQLIVTRLYELARKENLPTLKTEADTICNTYGTRGIHFLKPVWQKYQ